MTSYDLSHNQDVGMNRNELGSSTLSTPFAGAAVTVMLLRKVKCLGQCHTASEGESRDPDRVSLARVYALKNVNEKRVKVAMTYQGFRPAVSYPAIPCHVELSKCKCVLIKTKQKVSSLGTLATFHTVRDYCTGWHR